MPTYDFELGGADGNTATTGNTGASLVAAGAGNAIKLDKDEGVISGTLALHFHIGATTNSCWVEFPAVSGNPDELRFLIFPTFDSNGLATSSAFVTLYAADDTTAILRVSLSSTNQLQISDQGGAHTATINNDISGSFTAPCAVRVTLKQSTGDVKARFYSSADPLAAVDSYTGAEFDSGATVWALGSGGTGKQRVGINTTQTAQPQDLWADYFKVEAGTFNTWVTGPGSTTAPTANAGSDVYGVSGQTLTLTGSGTIGTNGGSITGYTWTNTSRPAGAPTPTITTPNAANTTVTNVVDGVYVFSLVVTQSGGGLSSAADTVSAWVSPVSQAPVKVKSTTKAATITREGSATTDAAALNDNLDTTGLRWPDNPSGETLWITWNPAGPGDITFDLGAQLTADSDDGTVQCTVTHYLADGTTVLYTKNINISVKQDVPLLPGLNAAAMTALGTSLSNRRELKTLVVMSV